MKLTQEEKEIVEDYLEQINFNLEKVFDKIEDGDPKAIDEYNRPYNSYAVHGKNIESAYMQLHAVFVSLATSTAYSNVPGTTPSFRPVKLVFRKRPHIEKLEDGTWTGRFRCTTHVILNMDDEALYDSWKKEHRKEPTNESNS